MSDRPKVAPPGSAAAKMCGCTCPVVDNGFGRGAYTDENGPQFWITEGCLIHDNPRSAPSQETDR